MYPTGVEGLLHEERTMNSVNEFIPQSKVCFFIYSLLFCSRVCSLARLWEDFSWIPIKILLGFPFNATPLKTIFTCKSPHFLAIYTAEKLHLRALDFVSLILIGIFYFFKREWQTLRVESLPDLTSMMSPWLFDRGSSLGCSDSSLSHTCRSGQ